MDGIALSLPTRSRPLRQLIAGTPWRPLAASSPLRRALLPALAWLLLGHTAVCAQPSRTPAAGARPSGSTAGLDVALVGATVGREVARRWCDGEDPKQAIEQALLEDLSRRRIGAGGLSDATTRALGEEISVEAFAQAFASCPQTARQVFRTLLQ